MPAKNKKSHTFNTRKWMPKKPATVVKPIMTIQSLNSRLEHIPKNDITMNCNAIYGVPEMRAKIVSASMTIAVPAESTLPSYSPASSTRRPTGLSLSLKKLTFSKAVGPFAILQAEGAQEVTTDTDSTRADNEASEDGYNGSGFDEQSNTSFEEASNVDIFAHHQRCDEFTQNRTLSPLTTEDATGTSQPTLDPDAPTIKRLTGLCVPSAATATTLLNLSALPPAFLPGYTNDIVPNTARVVEKDHIPAYACSSMSSWLSNPANASVRGTPRSLPRAGTAARRLDEKSRMFESLFAPSHHDKRVVTPEAYFEIDSLANDTDVEDQDMAQKVTSMPRHETLFPPVRCAKSPPGVSIVVPQINAHLDGVANKGASSALFGADVQHTFEKPFLWFDREPIAEIDPDFSDDEEDDRSETS